MYLFRTSSLSARIAWRIAVLSGIAIAGLITSVVGTAVIAVLNAQNDTHHAVHELSNRLETFLTRAETDLLVTAYSYDRSVLPEMTLRDILDRNAAVLTVAVLDHASGEVLHARQRVGLVDEATMLATVEAMPEPGWGEVYFNERNLPLIDMNVPVNRALDSKSAPIVLVATLDLSGLWDEVRNLDLSSGGYAYVVDRSGQVLVSPDMTQVRAATHAPDYVLSTPDDTGRHLLDQKIYAGLRGNRVLAEVEQLEMIPWYLVIEQPVFAVLDGLYMVIALTVGLIVTVLLVVTSTGRFMFQRVVMPLNILRGHIEEFRMGNMNQRIYLARQSNDEIDLLASTLNTMVDNIEQRTEELMVARAEALESSRLKSEFLSTISHELRTPLNAIMGYCDLMLAGMAGEFDEETQRMLERVDRSSNRLLRLIEDLLDLSRIESGNLAIEHVPFEVRRLAAEMHDEQVLEAEKKDLAFTVIIDSRLPDVLYSDPDRIKQILSNLISNAIKFTEAGEVTVTLYRLRAEWVIRVQDTGIGIPAHSHQYIWESFRQVDNSTTRAHGGTGLGLSIVRNLTVLMGGRVSVESEVDVGSTFTVTLPLLTEPLATLPESTTPVNV